MHRVAASGTGDPLTHSKSRQSFSQGDDRPGGGVTERQGLVEPVKGGFQGRKDPFAAGFIEHLSDEVGSFERFSWQRFPGEFHDHPLSPGRDQGGRVLDQRLSRSHCGYWHIGDGGLTGF